MKIKLIVYLFYFFAFVELHAQVLVQKITDENLTAIDMDFMQNGYKLAFSNMTSEDYLFKGREEEWKKCWINLMHELSNYMQKKGLTLNEKNSCYNRVYFNKQGTIIAYLYHLNEFTAAQEKLFDETIFEFLINHKVHIKAAQNYWQYGTLKFQ